VNRNVECVPVTFALFRDHSQLGSAFFHFFLRYSTIVYSYFRGEGAYLLKKKIHAVTRCPYVAAYSFNTLRPPGFVPFRPNSSHYTVDKHNRAPIANIPENSTISTLFQHNQHNIFCTTLSHKPLNINKTLN
jgi:hypothetical protein